MDWCLRIFWKMADLRLPWKQTRSLKQIEIQLFLGLCVVSLLIVSWFVYLVNVPISDKDDIESISDDVMHESDKSKYKMVDAVEQTFNRELLTKTVYPLTLTLPFLIENPQICEGKVNVLIIVHTAVFHFEKRTQLRQTIAKKDLFKERYTIRIAFLLGTTGDAKLNRLLKHENEEHHDIVQGEFEDTYRNLTLKGVMGFRWISHHCSHADLVLKTDDDIYVNIFQLVQKFLPLYGKKTRRIACNKMFSSTIIRTNSRWIVEDDEFRFRKFYPTYCSGFTVMLTTDTIKALYHAAQFTPVFWVDDVYLFGLLPAMANISHTSINRNVSLHTKVCEKSYKTDNPRILSCSAAHAYQYAFYWKRSLLTLNPEMQKLVNEEVLNQAHSENTIRFVKIDGRWHKVLGNAF